MVNIKRINKDDREILNKLLQLYHHNISVYFPIDFNSNTGEYEYDSLDKYFDDSTNYAYFITNGNNIAGFMLIDQTDEENIVQEMFVLNNYKKQGIGREAVTQVFNKYRGNWCVKSLPCSEPAELFWTNVINDYTNNNCNIEHVGKFNRAVITFNNEK